MLALCYALIAAVALERIVELRLADRNARALLARGAVEAGSRHYPLIVVLHAAWLAAIALFLPRPPTVHWTFLGLMLVLQGLRVWVIASLGPYWTTRIITLREAPLVRRGPYRWLRHPNYCVVAGEIVVFPLVFGEIGVTVLFSLFNAGVIAWRIRAENAALAPRRGLHEPL